MKSHSIEWFMRTSLLVGAGIALAIIALDAHFSMSLPSTPTVSLSTASAAETLAVPAATSTLSGADPAFWSQQHATAPADAPAARSQNAVTTLSAAVQAAPAPRNATLPPAEKPASLTIPSIDLRSPIIPVGVNAKGEMDVPDGSTNNVGWYKGGPKPGQPGTAVLDAHVFAAFEDLRHVKVGDEIIVQTESGARLKFVVERSMVYKLSELTPHMLFGGDGERKLNLITCAGSPVGDTYSHRLVVYTRFVEVI